MADVVVTVAKTAGITGYSAGNKRVTYRTVTTDTGDYVAGGFTVTAAQLGLKHIDHVTWGGVATQGTAGASAQGVGITYPAAGTSVVFQVYEAAASGAPLLEKTAEAMVANFTLRVRAEGW